MGKHHAVMDDLANLPYAREMQDYLIDLAVAVTGKKHPPFDYMAGLNRKSAIFVNESDIRDLLDDISAIFQERGYRRPWQLENDLIRHYQPNLPAMALNTTDFYVTEEMSPDQLTGYFHKTQVPLAMGFAALYRNVTNNPVSVLEIDYSNMRGTNEYFARLISTAEGVDNKTAMKEAMTMTDKASFIIAKTIRDTLQEFLHGRGDTGFIPLRTGGDEVRIIIPDLEQDETNIILKKIHDRIENVTARMGLHDHIHTKRPLDEWSNGFGACGAAFMLEAAGQAGLNDMTAQADLAIQKKKIELGRARLNNPAFAALKPPGSTDPARYTDPQTASLHLESVMAVMANFHQGVMFSYYDQPAPPTLEEIALSGAPDHFLTMEQIQTHFYDHLRSDLKNQNITLNKAQEDLLGIKVAKFPSQDYATGTLLSRDMPAMAGAAVAVTESLNQRLGRVDSPWTLGVSFHNLAGLNETLGHERSNLILHHQAQTILEQSLGRAGIARENVVLSHMGGGEFRAIIQPAIPEQDGTVRTVTAADIQTVCDGIATRTKALNNTKIVDFLKHHNIALRAGETVPEKFSDIRNPRAELQHTESGITATISAKPYITDETINTHAARRGGAITAFIGEHLEDAIRERREDSAKKTRTDMAVSAHPDNRKLF